MTTIPIIEARELEACGAPDCKDFDEDCDDGMDHAACWLYDPARGMCPFLRSREKAP